jgi:hypothetical protein
VASPDKINREPISAIFVWVKLEYRQVGSTGRLLRLLVVNPNLAINILMRLGLLLERRNQIMQSHKKYWSAPEGAMVLVDDETTPVPAGNIHVMRQGSGPWVMRLSGRSVNLRDVRMVTMPNG